MTMDGRFNGRVNGRSVHIDFSEVADLDCVGIVWLNQIWTELARGGWAVRFTPPHSTEARCFFLRMVADGNVAWAARSDSGISRTSAGPASAGLRG